MDRSTFEHSARSVFERLPEPEPIPEDQSPSPFEDAYKELEGQLIEVEDAIQIEDVDEVAHDEAEDEAIENGVLARGLEALAFYKSIHHENEPPFPGEWGIFIFKYALGYLSREIEDHYPGKYTSLERRRKAYRLLHYHERFHFRFDCWVISHESAMMKPLYKHYQNSVYWPHYPDVLEESLANIHALSSISREGIHSFAKTFMLNQPGAYSHIMGVDREELLSKLAGQTFPGSGSSLLPRPEHTPFIANPRNMKESDSWCPVHEVREVSPSKFVVPGLRYPVSGRWKRNSLVPI